MKVLIGVLCLGVAASVTARAELATGIEAVVDSSVVTYLDVEELTQQTIDILRRRYARDPVQFQKKVEEARKENLDKLTDRELILHEFKTAGYQLPDSVIDDIVKSRLRERFGDRSTATKTLQANGMTYEKFREQERDRYIIAAMRAKNISQEIIVSPYKIEKFYQDHLNDFKVADQVKLRLIVLNKGSDAEKAKRMAAEIYTKLKEGAPFGDMMTMYSQLPEKNQNTASPWREVDVLGKELAEAIKPLKAGEFTPPIEMSDSMWIVQVEERKDAYTKSLNQVRDQIEQELIRAEQERLEQAWILKLKKKTFVRYF